MNRRPDCSDSKILSSLRKADYLRHVNKLKEIYSASNSVKKITENLDLMQRINLNKQAAHEHVTSENNNKIALENKVLINRILSINKGNYKCSIPKLNMFEDNIIIGYLIVRKSLSF